MIDFGFGVKLGTVNEKDLVEMREARNDYSTWKWCRQPSLISPTDHRAWYEWQAKDNGTRMFSIVAPQREFAGVCGLTSIDWITRRAEFSLYVVPHYRKKGFAKAALQTLLSHAFSDLNMRLIWGETFEGNPAFDMFMSIGMTHDGARRDFYFKDGKYIAANLVSMRNDEWTSPTRSFASQEF